MILTRLSIQGRPDIHILCKTLTMIKTGDPIKNPLPGGQDAVFHKDKDKETEVGEKSGRVFMIFFSLVEVLPLYISLVIGWWWMSDITVY